MSTGSEAEAQAAEYFAVVARALADDNAKASVVFISGATGNNAESINGLFEPSEEKSSDGRVVYKKRGDASIIIEHFRGDWQVKPASSKGKASSWAMVFGSCALEACVDASWKVAQSEAFHRQTNVKMSTGSEAEAQAAELAAALAAVQAKIAADHASSSEAHQAAGSVSITRRHGGGYVSLEYVMHFDAFNTFVADVKLRDGCFYFELGVIDIGDGCQQFGFCTEGFQPEGQKGVGDDASSWAVDGDRQLRWHGGQSEPFGSKWSAGDVVGFALDMRSASSVVFSVSVNGSFAEPNGVAFGDISAICLSPAFSGYGQFSVNFGDRPFAHAPPAGNYVSVHAANQVNHAKA